MNNSDNQNKKKYILRFFICAVIFISVFVIINITTFKGLLSALFSVLLPIILGAVLAYMLNPILKLYEFKVFKRLKNKKVLRGLSILMTYLTFALILCAFGAILIPSLITSIGDLTANAKNYLITISDLINKAAVYVTGNPDHASLMTPGKLYELIMKIAKVFLPSSDDAVGIITGIGTVIKNILLAFFISLYMLISKERITAQFRKLVSAIFGNKGKKRLYRYLRLIRRTFGDYFIGMLFDALIVMCVSFILFAIFGIPYTPLVAVTIGITNIIPVFGPFIGAIPSFVLIFIAEPQKAIIFAILILIIQQIDGNIIAPKVLGNSTGISSLGVIIAITIMGSYFGIIGMIIGVPIFATAIAIGKEFIDHRLRISDLPTDTAEYYADDSLVDPYEHHESFSSRIFHKFGVLLGKIMKVFKKKKAADSESNVNDNADTQVFDEQDPTESDESMKDTAAETITEAPENTPKRRYYNDDGDSEDDDDY